MAANFVWREVFRESDLLGSVDFNWLKARVREHCLPPGVFTQAGAGVQTNLLFFTAGRHTERIWYYDLSDIKVGKRTPLTIDKFDDFFRLLPERGISERSWTVTRTAIEAKNFDLKAINPHRRNEEDTRTPEELLDLIEAKGREVTDALAGLRRTPNSALPRPI